MKKVELAALGVIVATAIGGCSGGGGSEATAPLTLSVTDAPIRSTAIASVCVDFTRITVHYAGQQEVVLDYKPLPAQVRPETHCLTGVWDGTGPVPPVRQRSAESPGSGCTLLTTRTCSTTSGVSTHCAARAASRPTTTPVAASS